MDPSLPKLGFGMGAGRREVFLVTEVTNWEVIGKIKPKGVFCLTCSVKKGEEIP